MVFANLPEHEKDAFFNLLDEYFSSRPDIFGGGENAASADADDAGYGLNSSRGAAASAVHRALASNPEATSRLVSAGLNRGIPKNSPYAAVAHNPEINNAVGRVAAASLAFSGNKPPAPPLPPHRSSGSNSPGTPAEPTRPLSNVDKPAPPVSRKFGDVDTSSAKGFYNSLRNSTANKSYTPPPPVVAPAFAPKKNSFAPPPTRRVVSSTTEPSANSAPHTPPAPPPPPMRYQPPVEEEQGEWAEALYDYDSTEAGDLPIRAEQRVLITERTSDDWWTGEADGKKGLFPASYVKIL